MIICYANSHLICILALNTSLKFSWKFLYTYICTNTFYIEIMYIPYIAMHMYIVYNVIPIILLY